MKLKNRKSGFLYLILTSATLAGCTTFLPQNQNPRDPLPLPANIVAIADIQSETPIFTKLLEEDGIEHWSVVSNNELLRFDYLKTAVQAKTTKELIIIYRILNDAGGTISGLIADICLDAGYDCIVVQQENFLTHEFVRPVLPGGTHDSYDEYNAKLSRGVGRILHYWLPEHPRLIGRYGFVGISMGGIHAIGAASIFPDAEIAVAIMAGGDNAELFKNSQEGLVIDNREKLLTAYALYYGSKYPNARINYAQVLYRDINKLHFNIIKLAKCIDTRRVRLMISLYDDSVPTFTQWNLYHALGGPETRLFPTGHYSLAFYYFSVKEQLLKWLRAVFKNNE